MNAIHPMRSSALISIICIYIYSRIIVTFTQIFNVAILMFHRPMIIITITMIIIITNAVESSTADRGILSLER
jgi:hypothetical protein